MAKSVTKAKAEAKPKAAPRKPKATAANTPTGEARVMKIDASRYDRQKYKGADGRSRHSANNGDAVARALLGMDHDALLQVMDDNDLGERLQPILDKGNRGQFRMNLGNMLRGMVRKGTPVRIGKNRVQTLDQNVEPVVTLA